MWASCGRRPEVLASADASGMPAHVLDRFVALMRRCWEMEPAARPEMCDVATELEEISQQLASNGSNASELHEVSRPQSP